MYEKEKIEKQIEKLNELHVKNGNCKKILFGKFVFIDKDGNIIKRYNKEMNKEYLTGKEMLLKSFKGYQINGCSLLIPKLAFEDCGNFATDLRYMQDLDMWYRMMLKGYDFIYRRDAIAYSRVHDKQATVRLRDVGIKDRERIGHYMIESLKNKYWKNKNLLLYYTYFCMRKNNQITGKEAYRYLKENKQINIIDKTKIIITKFYGKIRPIIVRCYYKLAFKIKIKKRHMEEK